MNNTISTSTAGASIRYTTDGSTPSSTVGTVYSAPITGRHDMIAVEDINSAGILSEARANGITHAKLIAKGTPVAQMNTGIDGGMNKVFAARVPEGNTGLSEGGDSQGLSVLAMSRAPGTIPSTVNPPRAPASPSNNLLQGAPEEPKLAVAPAPTAGPTRVANAAPTAQSDGFFSSLARKVGLGGNADATASTPPPAAKPKK